MKGRKTRKPCSTIPGFTGCGAFRRVFSSRRRILLLFYYSQNQFLRLTNSCCFHNFGKGCVVLTCAYVHAHVLARVSRLQTPGMRETKIFLLGRCFGNWLMKVPLFAVGNCSFPLPFLPICWERMPSGDSSQPPIRSLAVCMPSLLPFGGFPRTERGAFGLDTHCGGLEDQIEPGQKSRSSDDRILRIYL